MLGFILTLANKTQREQSMSSTPQALLQRHRLSVEDYHCMGDAGIFNENDRVELIEGEIIDMAPIGSNHAGTVKLLSNIMKIEVGTQAIVSTQDPVALDSFSEPEPDIALLKPRNDFYRTAHPGPEDVLLIIEVADSSLRYDHKVKIPLYARHAIFEVWLVDLENGRLLLHQNPQAGQYQKVIAAKNRQALVPLQLSSATFNLEMLFQS